MIQLRNSLLEPRRGKQICLSYSYVLLRAFIIVHCCKHYTEGSTELRSKLVTSQKTFRTGLQDKFPPCYRENSSELKGDEVEALTHTASRPPQRGSNHCQKKRWSFHYSQATKILNSGKNSPYTRKRHWRGDWYQMHFYMGHKAKQMFT